MDLYPYASGNLLENCNTYYYTKYEGKIFLSTWRKNRKTILNSLSGNKPLHIQPILFTSAQWSQKLVGGKIINTVLLLDDLFNEINIKEEMSPDLIEWINRLVKRFEVFKRVHEAYNSDFKAIDKSAYNNLGLYIRLCALIDVAYSKTKDLSFLNVMLKCLDTLCAMRNQLKAEEKSYLAQLIINENIHIDNISNTHGIVL